MASLLVALGYPAPPSPPYRPSMTPNFVQEDVRDLKRVHATNRGGDEFNPSTGYSARFSPIFDAAGQVIPVIYAATSFEAALMETMFHDVLPSGVYQAIPESKLIDGRSMSWLIVMPMARPMILVDLDAMGLLKLGLAPHLITTSSPAFYAHSRDFAAFLHATYPNIQGLRWVSNKHNRELCYLFFGDRIEPGELHVVSSTVISTDRDLLETVYNVADAIGVTIIPSTGP